MKTTKLTDTTEKHSQSIEILQSWDSDGNYTPFKIEGVEIIVNTDTDELFLTNSAGQIGRIKGMKVSLKMI